MIRRWRDLGETVRILVVEPHAETRRWIERAAAEAGYSTDGATDLASARAHLETGGYGAVILDVALPDGSGIDLCREMRASGDPTPVLLLTARGKVADRVEGLDAGADDCLARPFALAELLARIRALHRREPRFEPPVVHFGRLEVRLADRRVRIDGREVPLTAREFAILAILVRRRGHVVSRSEILRQAWERESPGARNSLEVLIARLRRKLSAGAPGLIRTHRGLGYSLGLEE